jgi:aldehyde dehydrogenase (NAD(P)+)
MEPATVDLDPLAPLRERAPSFARLAPREKAALLQAVLPRLAAAAPELCTLACQGRGVDPASGAGAPAWIAGVVPLLAAVRSFGASLAEIAARGRPALGSVKRAKDGRAWARVKASSFAARLHASGSEVELRFEEGVTREAVLAGQARAYQQAGEAQGGVAIIGGVDLLCEGMPRALHALFVEGKVAQVEADAASAALLPRLAEVFAPLIEPGWLRLAAAPEGHDLPRETSAASPRRVRPWVVVPYLHAADELAFQASNLASALALAPWIDRDVTHLLVLAEGWEQRALFLSLVQKALAALPAWGAFEARAIDAAQLSALDGLPAATLPVVALGSDEAARFLPAAVAFVNEVLGGGQGLSLTVHPSQQDDLQLAPVIDEALRALRYGAVALNAPASLIRLAPALPWIAHPAAAQGGGAVNNARMVERVEKVLLRAPLFSPFKPGYFCDNRRALEMGPRLARLAAQPSLGALLGLVGTLRRR